MAYLQTDSDIDKALDAPDAGIPLSGGGGMSDSGSELAAGPTGDTGLVGSSQPFSTGTSFSQVSGRLDQLSGRLGDAASSFYDTAGPRREFGAGNEAALMGAISGSGSMEDALGLTNAAYTGPAGLDESVVAPLETELGEVRAFSNPISTGRNLTAWAQQETSGLTPGEARANAAAYAPDYMGAARDAFRSAGVISGDVGSEREAAGAFATGRAEDEVAMRDAARSYVDDQRSGLVGSLSGRAEEENQRAQDIQAAYEALLNTGLTDELSRYAPELGDLNTEAYQRELEARSVYDKVMANERYAPIADIPVGQLVIDTDGIPRVHITVGGKDYNTYRLKRGGEIIDGLSREESVSIGHLAEHRQAELERWFSPVTARTQNVLGKAGAGEREAIAAYADWFRDRGYRGEYADVAPMYTDELQYQAMPETGIGSYVSVQEAPEATAQTVATEEEALQMQNILQLLGSQESFERRETPQAGVHTDVEGFNAAEAARYAQDLDALREAERARRAQVTGARQQYVDEKNEWRRDLLGAMSYVPIFNVPSTIAGAGGARGGGRVAVPGLPDYEYERIIG